MSKQALARKVHYRNGFEDALELCLKEIAKVATLDEATSQIQYFLSLVKERKLKTIKEVLGAL